MSLSPFWIAETRSLGEGTWQLSDDHQKLTLPVTTLGYDIFDVKALPDNMMQLYEKQIDGTSYDEKNIES